MLRIAFAMAVMALTGCATESLLLSSAELSGMRIEEVRISYSAKATVWWGKAEQDYVAEVNAKAPKDSRPKASPVRFTDNGGIDQSNADEYEKLIATPEAKAYLRTRLSALVSQQLNASVVPKFSGNRAVHLEVEIHSFVIPSAIQRVTLGGSPMLLAVTTLKDARTGADLGKLDRGAAATAGQGVLGVLVDQAFSDLEDRVVQSYVNNVLCWLKPS